MLVEFVMRVIIVYIFG